MTDKELEELKSRKDKLNSEISSKMIDVHKMNDERYKLETEIKEEEKRRETKNKMAYHLERAKDIFVDYNKHRNNPRQEIWIVEIGGMQYVSGKSKRAWTSRAKALNAVTDYLAYHYFNREILNYREIVDNLVEEGFIVPKQIL